MDNSHPTSSGANVVRYSGVCCKVISQMGFCGSGTQTNAKSERKRDKETGEEGGAGSSPMPRPPKSAPPCRTRLTPSSPARTRRSEHVFSVGRSRRRGGRRRRRAAQRGLCALGATTCPSRRQVALTRRCRAQTGVTARPSRGATTRPARTRARGGARATRPRRPATSGTSSSRSAAVGNHQPALAAL